MNRILYLIPASVCVAGLFCLSSFKVVHSQETPPSADNSKPTTVKVETEKIVTDLTLKGTVEADQATELFLDPKSWSGSFIVKSAVPHGTRVKKGDIVLEIDTQKIDQAISDLKLDRDVADISLTQAKAELPVLEQFLPLNLAAADRDRQNAEDDLKRYNEVERDHQKKSAEFQLKNQLNWLDYAREELKQLQKMYRDKDLTEETEEIILKRQRHQVEQLEFGIESLKLQQERENTLDRPRRDQTMKEGVQKQTLNWQKSKQTLPLELSQKKLALQKQQIERSRTDERLKDLEADRAAMVVRAPADGIVYHGQADRAQWNTATVSGHLKRNGTVQPKEIFMTIVAPKPVSLRADVEERDLHSLKEGLSGQAVPVAFPSMKLPCQLKSISNVPRAAGTFEAHISLDIPDNVESILPGMVLNAKLVTYRNDAALVVPTSAIFHDDGSDVPYVYVVADGKPVRTEIKTGKVTGNKTEVLSGLKTGTEIRASKP